MPHPACILTDSLALLPSTPSAGSHLARVLPFKKDGTISAQTLIAMYENLARDYGSIIMLTASQHLSGLYASAIESARAHGGSVNVIVIDTLNIGFGIGWLATLAAEMSLAGSAPAQIEKTIRATIPRIYQLICIPDLNRLVKLDRIEPAQASAGSILGIEPMLTLEAGTLNLFDKARSQRHLFDAFADFASEFETPQKIALARGSRSRIRVRALRESIGAQFPQTEYSETQFTPALTALFGEESLTLAVMEV
jgi:DegV family protein with EDD domain